MNETQTGDGVKRLPEAARTYRMIQAVTVAGILTAVACAAVVLLRLPVPLPFVVAVGALFLTVDLVFIPLRHHWFRYRVSEDEYFVSRGRFLLTTVTVAVPQILHAEVIQGPVLRQFGLATVRVKMVVGDHELGPVTTQEADAIRGTILSGSGRTVDES